MIKVKAVAFRLLCICSYTFLAAFVQFQILVRARIEWCERRLAEYGG
jgi:hypothetical protein